MKKCPKCGNPCYDGAHDCGNCGYTFPKTRNKTSVRRDIFSQEPKIKKSNNTSTTEIIYEKKYTIAAILFVTIIVIFGIVITGNNNNSLFSFNNDDIVKYDANGFFFFFPTTWTVLNVNDVQHPKAIFYQNENKVIIEFYNVTTKSPNLKEVTKKVLNTTLKNGNYVDLVEIVKLDGKPTSNIIVENSTGYYTRHVSIFNNGKLYVFKISGNTLDSITSEDIDKTILSVDVT